MSAALERTAEPTVYRENIFRVTGLPIAATTRDIRRLSQEVKLAAALGTPMPARNGVLPLDPPPTPDEMLDALQAFQDPERRLADELYWLWQPGTPIVPGDPRTMSLEGAHDLAVLAHCEALDLEHAAGVRTLSDQERVQRESAWRAALPCWAALAGRPDLRERLRRRVEELEDPRITTGTVRRIVEGLPMRLLSVSARLAVTAAQRDREADAARHIRLIKDSPFPDEIAGQALRDAVAPLLERVHRACVVSEAEAAGDRRNADAAGERLLAETRALLTTLTRVLGQDHPTAQAASDEVALAALSHALAYHNATEDLAATRRLLDGAAPLATQGSTVARIRENLDAVDSLLLRTRFTKIEELVANGKVDEAQTALHVWRDRTDDARLRGEIDTMLSDPRHLATQRYRRPSLWSLNGCGVMLYGHRAPDQKDGTFVSTLYATLVFMPLIPLTAYVVGHSAEGRLIYGKVPLTVAALWWRRLIPVLAVLLLATPVFSGWGLLLAVLTAGLVVGMHRLRCERLCKCIPT